MRFLETFKQWNTYFFGFVIEFATCYHLHRNVLLPSSKGLWLHCWQSHANRLVDSRPLPHRATKECSTES